MARVLSRYCIVTVVLLISVLLLGIPGCGGGDDEPGPLARPGDGSTEEPVGDIVFTIGNLTDLTGVSANAQQVINFALDDLVEYYNDEQLIPGVRLKVVTYDGQFDPSNDIPGYEWLLDRGADLIVTAVTSSPVTLKTRADKDHVLLFSLSGNSETLTPPGYVFAPATLPEHEALTLLTWIAENDWDWEANGPAKLGGASWAEPNGESFVDTAEAYAKAHPEQFEWVGSYATPVGNFVWSSEVQALKDCDYLFTPNPIAAFAREYRNAGYDGVFLGNGPHVALLKLIDDAKLWDELDGMLIITPSRWWGEDGELVDLREKLLYENHPGDAEEIKRMGGAYNALDNLYMVLEIVRKAAETAGPGDIDPQALYDAAKSISLVVDGVERYSFGETKRWACNYYGIYEASEAEETLVRADPDWLYRVTEP